jgi:drug/metabolite transporter (DMT)-like permease
VGVLALSALSWSAGALYSRRAALPTSPTRATAVQMIAGAVLSVILGLALGEHRSFSFADVTLVSALAVAYLFVAGALVGFSAYLWLMRVTTPSRVATHAYVNPVVAVLLGWAVAGERVTGATLVAMGVIVAAVVLIVSAPRRGEAPSTTRDEATPRRDSLRHAESAETDVALSARGRVRAIIPVWRARATKIARPIRSRST